MLGLQKVINQKKKSIRAGRNERFSYTYIAKLLGITYQAVAYKFKNDKFTSTEALAIFNSLVTEENLRTLQFFEYLFTEQN